MRFSLIIFVVLLAILSLTLAQVSYEDCCLRYVSGVKKSTKKMVTSYRRQEMDGGCNIPAIVFKLKRGRQFCADPRQKWVVELMYKVNRKGDRTDKRKVITRQ
ncbi:C-C motif chemokine 21 [Chanos chanos]|uniref:C-C motif chemokine 21 n=1 Tax=Chanos chanos TaxID=29144 RepID=A0A6J2VF22_CHACN|nr:C-C motif chemokine 21-like [Chanos chanos]